MQTKANRIQLGGWAAFVGLVLADVGVLVGLRPAATRAMRHLPHLGGWLAAAGCDRALEQLAAAALWVVALWLALGLFAALAAALPGRPGRLAALACRAVLPHAARKLLAGTAGLGVLLAPAAAMAVTSPAASPAGITASAAHPAGSSLPPPTWPMTTTAPTTAPASKSNAGAERTVRVRPGDCLWLIAANRLPAGASNDRIATYWPRWYAANRDVVGPDPDLLQPGEVLHVPAPPAQSSH